jgi:hypothetical protein
MCNNCFAPKVREREGDVGCNAVLSKRRGHMRFNHLSRREFATLLGTATATWPVAARAQQMARTHHIGVLMAWAENQPEGKAEAGALQDGLSKLGWTAGRDVQIDYRWPGNDIDRIMSPQTTV